MQIEVLSKEKCCGCASCMNTCPVDAIRMSEDQFGFTYPQVDNDKCLDCGLCYQKCVFTKSNYGQNSNLNIFVGNCVDKNVLMKSSSGGIFSAVAHEVIKSNGIVYGAAWIKPRRVEHVGIDSIDDLDKIRGSKYVQSEIGLSFREVKNHLTKGRIVCFVGTPCQISGLKSFLGKHYENLLTIDIVCHGVPNQRMLNDDLNYMAKKYKISPQFIKFRDKKYGWGTKGSISDGKKSIKYNAVNSPYYYFFLKANLYRPSCYNCRFPAEGRQGDLTIGDYWNVNSFDEKTFGNTKYGISCILINSDKGKEWFDRAANNLQISPSSFESISRRNGQLVESSKPTADYDELLDDYQRNGYNAILLKFNKFKLERMFLWIKSLVPYKIKRFISSIH